MAVLLSPVWGGRPSVPPSPRPPTLSLGMMRSSEPCFRNTFPVKTRRRVTLRWQFDGGCRRRRRHAAAAPPPSAI